jgi:hypothetical protein
MTQHDLQLAVHYDPGHPTKPWALGIEVVPGKLQILERYLSKEMADRVLKRLLPTFRKHIAS